MKTVSCDQVATSELAAELALPPRVQEALGELVSSAKEGLLALSVGLGLGVLAELMEEEVDEVVGPKGKHVRGFKITVPPGRRIIPSSRCSNPDLDTAQPS